MIPRRIHRWALLAMALFAMVAAATRAFADPTADSQNLATTFRTPLAITLTGSDPDGLPLTYFIVQNPTQGTLSGAPPNVTYTPAPGFQGTDAFTFQTNNGNVNSNLATVTITVNPPNAPVAVDQSVSTPWNTPLAITLTGSDANNLPLTYSIVGGPAHGTLSGTAPNVIYTPATGYFGADSFTFVVNNGFSGSNVATVSITVIGPPAPTANDETVSTAFGTPVSVTLTGSDPSNYPLTYSIVGGPAHGTLSGTPPNMTYTPAAGFAGADSFTYKANNGFTDSNIATVSLTVQAPGAPTANAQSQNVAINTPAPITLTGSDPGGMALTYAVVTNPAHGTLTGSGTDWTYTPAQDYTGPDSFTFKVNNGVLDSGPAAVSLSVMPLLPPVLDVPTTLTTNDSITVTPAPGSFPAQSYEWSFTPVSPTEGSGSSTGFTKTSDPEVALPSAGLAPGTYDLHVHAVAGQVTSKDTVARITVLPGNVSAVRVYPNPWKADRDADVNVTFDHVAPGSTIKIFDIAGHWVRTLNAATNSVTWDRRNDQGNEVASGLYLYLVTDPQGEQARKKLTIIK